MRRAVATKAGQMDSRLKTARLKSFAGRFACLVRYGADTKSPSGVLQHLRHKRHSVQTAMSIQGTENFVFAANFHEVAGAKTRQSPGHATPFS
jgi:hypothetical protein